jgi:hypothetical protein
LWGSCHSVSRGGGSVEKCRLWWGAEDTDKECERRARAGAKKKVEGGPTRRAASKGAAAEERKTWAYSAESKNCSAGSKKLERGVKNFGSGSKKLGKKLHRRVPA